MGFETSLFLDQPGVNSPLLCAICRDVMKEATTACTEGHAFCKACLEPASVKDCPSCRGSLVKTNCVALRNLIDDLKVHCPNKQQQQNDDDKNNKNDPPPKKRRKSSNVASKSKALDRCEWTGPLCQLEVHKRDVCRFQLVPCEFDNCQARVARKDLKKHSSQCGFRPVTCKKCKATLAANGMDKHKCPKEMTSCTFCNKRMLRRDLLGPGAPDYCKEEADATTAIAERTMSSNSTTAFTAVGGVTIRIYADDEEQGVATAATTTSGTELFQDIMSERMPFVPTSSECARHYKECPEVMLRCEFHKHGCTEKLARKNLAQHHAEKAQFHAALVTAALDDIYDRLDKGVQREHAKLMFGMERYYLSGNRNLRSGPTTVAGHPMSLKLHLHRDACRSLAVSIRASNRHRANDVLQLYDVSIGLSVKKKEEPTILFRAPGPLVLTSEAYDTEAYKAPLEYSDAWGTHPVTGTKLQEMIASVTEGKVFLVASFSMSTRRTRELDGVFSTSSPSPSPNASPAREYADY